jgi:hypothetical protein
MVGGNACVVKRTNHAPEAANERMERSWMRVLYDSWLNKLLDSRGTILATADATGRTKREKIIKANPFLERFTVADLRNWADRKMRIAGS